MGRVEPAAFCVVTQERAGFFVGPRVRVLGKSQPSIRFKMQKDGKPGWNQTTIDRLWVTTQREAMIESGPSGFAGSQRLCQTVTKIDGGL